MIDTVHIVFKTHLDVGFTDFAAAVADRYLNHYIPAALDLAEALRAQDGPERFIWTTGAWLIVEYLDRATPAQQERMAQAIAAGDVAWHAIPFTTHTELMDADLFRFGLSLSQRLDQRFGKETIAAKMTDVPGHTRAIVPHLAEAGIKLLHLGVNPSSTRPGVPPAFRWHAPAGEEVVVLYAPSYGDVQTVDGLDHALLFAHTSDNLGPPTADDVAATFAAARRQFPGAEIVASTLDRFAEALLPVAASLPVVTEELGDTWIHGAGTDPLKVSRYRALLRLRRAWRKRGVADAALDGFSRKLMMVPEHTWGLDEKVHLGDYANYAAADFAAARARDTVGPDAVPEAYARYAVWFAGPGDDYYDAHYSPGRVDRSYSRFAASWQEQRDYLTQAVAALEDPALQAEAEQALAACTPVRPDLREYGEFDPAGGLTHADLTAAWNPDTGALTTLVQDGRHWCDDAHAIGAFSYETFSQADYDRWLRDYNRNLDDTGIWATPDFSKPGMDAAVPPPRHATYRPRLTSTHVRHNDKGAEVLLALRMPAEACTLWGAPKELFVAYRFADAGVIDVRLQWFGKQACRLPEASWISFAPAVPTPTGWRLDKMGTLISPLEVVRDGNRNLHAIGRSVSWMAGDAAVVIESVDAPLVAPGARRLLQFDNRQPPLGQGIHFNLHNNVWGTNFPMWYEDDALFRFRLHFSTTDT